MSRNATAAYAASQPLFEALQAGNMRINEQKVHITRARNLVQNLHVKLTEINGQDESAKHDYYMDCVVKAWRSATQTYEAIFRELMTLNAADASEGREASKRYEEFAALATTARQVSEVACEFPLHGPPSWPEAPSTPEKRKRSREEEHDESSDVKMDTGTDAPEKEGSDGGQAKDNKQTQQNEGAEKTLSKHQRKRLRKKHPAADHKDSESNHHPSSTNAPTQPPSNPNPPPTSSLGKENHTPIAGVEYEDVSAEVEARLKAKAEKRQAKKTEKKRKRESGDSLLEAKPVAEIAERPKRKKTKGADEMGPGGAQNGGDTNQSTASGKRANEVGEVGAGGEGGARKRRRGRL
ncbi:hypothetical protein KC318_g774 [Hortaea werneckii]|nr:hypothetical protein KC334_g2767 [Hortaea werneckii]KAI7020489.1 hypothetical protein KC355_g2712 [Hortaea werneckii]KAI7675722.1 hypothetical protein KC318_g774 [Hortaea werneckii]